MSFNLFTNMVVNLAIEHGVATTPDELTVRNIITHLDFDSILDENQDRITYSTKHNDTEKVMILYQFSYAPKDANPNNAQNIMRPFALKVVKNNNYVFSIQSVKEMNQRFEPILVISTVRNDNVDIIFDGYDGTANIYLFGLVAERLGENMNG